MQMEGGLGGQEVLQAYNGSTYYHVNLPVTGCILASPSTTLLKGQLCARHNREFTAELAAAVAAHPRCLATLAWLIHT